MSTELRDLFYLVAAVLFILGLKGLAHPRTAVRGNLLAAGGMFLAVLVTVLDLEALGGAGWSVLLVGVAVGGGCGWTLAVRVQMTQMPQLVALFNGFGGGASAVVAGLELFRRGGALETFPAGAVAASGLIGGVTLTGSLVAFGKLQGVKWVPDRPLTGGQLLNLGLLLAAVVLGVWLTLSPEATGSYLLLVPVALLLGVGLVVPIGGADMPVVISLLNSYSGLAAAATGFVIGNNLLIIAGSLVGASGIILTRIMCRAMNRSLTNVLFGGLGTETTGPTPGGEFYAGKVKSTSAEEVAMLLDGVQRVVFVPGYGMAVAQAQHAVRDLANMLEDKGASATYAIHPVAGRMPGHMNVLLAEADVPYDKLKDLDESNQLFEQTDVVFVIGANDVVNPVARTDPNSPIAGMPILDVDRARTTVVIKRSLSPGFAGIPNPLFIADNTLMLFGDGRQAIQDIIAAVKENA